MWSTSWQGQVNFKFVTKLDELWDDDAAALFYEIKGKIVVPAGFWSFHRQDSKLTRANRLSLYLFSQKILNQNSISFSYFWHFFLDIFSVSTTYIYIICFLKLCLISVGLSLCLLVSWNLTKWVFLNAAVINPITQLTLHISK